ncbi:hypothetical protein AB0K57_29505 [Streptomyces halstedii]|uniref:hypothetical protein n=1 Tax=Streptomyces halstedii TaxID=1944 RepID=UPI00345F94FB
MRSTGPSTFPTQLSGAYWLESPVMEHATGCRCPGTHEPQPELRSRRVPEARTIMLCIAGATVIIAVCASVL